MKPSHSIYATSILGAGSASAGGTTAFAPTEFTPGMAAGSTGKKMQWPVDAPLNLKKNERAGRTFQLCKNDHRRTHKSRHISLISRRLISLFDYNWKIIEKWKEWACQIFERSIAAPAKIEITTSLGSTKADTSHLSMLSQPREITISMKRYDSIARLGLLVLITPYRYWKPSKSMGQEAFTPT